MKQKHKLQETELGLEIVRVSPRGRKIRAAIVTREEMAAEAPRVALIHPTLAVGDLLEISKLLEDWLASRSALAN